MTSMEMRTKIEKGDMSRSDFMLDIDLSKKYIMTLEKGTFMERPRYFTNAKNSEIEKDLRNPRFYKITANRIWAAMGAIRRYLTDNPVGLDEIFTAKGKKTKYLSGDGEDFKFATWAVVKSYLLDILSPDIWYIFMPKSEKAIHKWNENLTKIRDVPVEVLELFYINPISKKAYVMNYVFEWADFYGIDVPGRLGETKDAGFAGGWPSVWSSRIVDGEYVVVDEKDLKPSFNSGTKDKSVPDNVQDKTGGENEYEFQKNNDPKPEDKEHPQDDVVVVADTVEDINKIVEETVPEEPNEEKLDLRAPGKLKFAVLFEPPVFEEKQKEFPEFNINGSSAVNANPPEDQLVEMYGPDGIDDIYINVNKQWAERFPGLEEFTKLVHKVGLYVNYSTVTTFDTVDVFRADLISKQGVIVKSLLVDYNCIYGDGIRIGTATDKHGSVFNEIWIGLYYKNYVSKLICGTLTEEDVEEVMSKYPAGANIVARMVDFTELPSDIAYPTWKALIARLSKVVINLPSEARFRLVNYKSAYEWVLACAENVDISFISNNDQRLRGLVYPKIREKGLYVQYDENKFKDSNGYIVGYQDGSLVDFNPYEFKSIGKKNQQNDK